MAVSQCRPADMLTVAVVLREGIVLEHGIDGAAPDIDDVSLLAVGVVFARSTTVIRHLIVFAVNPHGETDARNDVRIVAVTLAGKRHVNLAIGSDAPDVGAAHPEVKHRRGNNCAADDQHFTIALFYGKVAQMFLHDLQMIRLPQPFVLLLVVAVGQLETASGNLCTATLIAPNLALTAGHCLLTPPKGKADKAVALRFVSNKGLWRYDIHDIEGRVDPTLGKRLKADGDGWIVPPAAAPWDFGLIVLRNPPSGITPLPLFEGDKAALTAALKSAGRKVTQAGYPEDHLDTLYSHQNCEVTGWAQTSVMSHQCDTLPGDSGSPLMLHTDDGWQLIGVQSSAPAAKDRWRADNRAISVTGFRDKLDQLSQK